jgi:ComF family protein
MQWTSLLRPPVNTHLNQCEVCRRGSDARLCQPCLDRFAMPRHRCQRCALVLPGGSVLCGNCQREPPAFERTVCAVDYGYPWDRLITRFKFHGMSELAAPLAAMLARAVVAATPTPPLLVLPVPLAPARLAERGYNQAWELARRVAATLRLRAQPQLLQRVIDTAHQTELNRTQRRANLRAALQVPPTQRDALRGRHVALVDDVMTTCATAEEASLALLRAGAASVQVWVLARTPAD